MKKHVFTVATAILLWTSPAFSQGWNVDLVGSLYQNWGSAWTVALRDDYAFVGVRTVFDDPFASVLSVVDVSEPTDLLEVATCEVRGKISAMALNGNYAILGMENGSLVMVDISDPLSPWVISRTPTPPYLKEMQVVGDRIYAPYGIWTNHTGLVIFDISDPARPTILGEYRQHDWASSVAVNGNYAYLNSYAEGTWTLKVLDVRDPANISLVTTLSQPGNAYSIALNGNYAYVGNDAHITTLDITNPASPVVIGTSLTNGGNEIDIVVSGNYAFLNGASGGLHIMDISHPANPVYLATCPESADMENIAAAGSQVMSTNGPAGIKMFDVSTPQRPVLDCSYDVNRFFENVVTQGNYAYLADRYHGLLIMDISDPTHPIQVTGMNEIGETRHVMVSDDYAYVANWNGLNFSHVVDITDPEHPFVAGQYQLEGILSEVVEETNLAYASAWSSGVKILDLSNPVAPVQVGAYNVGGFQRVGALDVQGRYLYALCAYEDYIDEVIADSMLVLSLADPVNPVLIGVCDVSDGANALVAEGRFAYIAGDSPDLRLLNIDDPQQPFTLSVMNFPGNASDVAKVGSTLYLTCSEFLRVINVVNPLHPRLVGTYRLPDCTPNSIAALGDLALVANGSHLEIYDYITAVEAEWDSRNDSDEYQPALSDLLLHKFKLCPASPNPFNPSTAISYELRAASQVSLKVYDIAGRLVATLVDGWREAGSHQVTFDGSNLSTGIYLLMMQASGSGTTPTTAVQKMVLVK
jgi:hypothetical protein